MFILLSKVVGAKLLKSFNLRKTHIDYFKK